MQSLLLVYSRKIGIYFGQTALVTHMINPLMRILSLTQLACVGLHAILVLAHIALLGVWVSNAGRSVLIPPDTVSSTQTYITVVSQIIIIVSVSSLRIHSNGRCLNISYSLTQLYLFC